GDRGAVPAAVRAGGSGLRALGALRHLRLEPAQPAGPPGGRRGAGDPRPLPDDPGPLRMSFDTRLTPLRDGVASRALEGIASAEVYLEPKAMACAVAATGIHRAADLDSEQMDQLLFGEGFEAVEEEGPWRWGQARRDGYVGFVLAAALAPLPPEPTHRVAALRTYAFARS